MTRDCGRSLLEQVRTDRAGPVSSAPFPHLSTPPPTLQRAQLPRLPWRTVSSSTGCCWESSRTYLMPSVTGHLFPFWNDLQGGPSPSIARLPVFCVLMMSGSVGFAAASLHGVPAAAEHTHTGGALSWRGGGSLRGQSPAEACWRVTYRDLCSVPGRGLAGQCQGGRVRGV